MKIKNPDNKISCFKSNMATHVPRLSMRNLLPLFSTRVTKKTEFDVLEFHAKRVPTSVPKHTYQFIVHDRKYARSACPGYVSL